MSADAAAAGTPAPEALCPECAARELQKLGNNCPEMDTLEQRVQGLENLVNTAIEKLRVTTLAMKYEHLEVNDRERAQKVSDRVKDSTQRLTKALNEAILPTHLVGGMGAKKS